MVPRSLSHWRETASQVRASNSLSRTGKVPNTRSRQREWRKIASLVYERLQNPRLGGRNGHKRPQKTSPAGEITISLARLASSRLSHTRMVPEPQSRWPKSRTTTSPIKQNDQNPNPASKNALKQPLSYRKGLKIQVSPARPASAGVQQLDF